MKVAVTLLTRLHWEPVLYTLFLLFYNPPVQLKPTQLCPHARPHPNTQIQRLSLFRHIFLRSLFSSILSSPWESV
ncbi:unnamed protein product [Hymenolepis diminuta]|uniref:Uncharacterized protein n=1 Tax=Hymenolepis diminuta TaxID=6216 RepID=A0A564Z655_HYMDI|nr:unnamed protein product [Hymenolepis diminuta]